MLTSPHFSSPQKQGRSFFLHFVYLWSLILGLFSTGTLGPLNALAHADITTINPFNADRVFLDGRRLPPKPGYDRCGFAANERSGVANYGYDAIYILIQPGGDLETDLRYEGTERLENAEMYSLRARYYNPTIGRFWTMDT